PRRADGAGRGQRAVLPPRRPRPGRRDRRSDRRRGRALPRRRVHRRLGPVVPRRRPGAVRPVRARGDVAVGGPAQVRLRAEGRPGGVDVLNLADEMTARGWLLQPQPPFAQPDGDLPATLHLTVTGATAGRVEALLADLADAARAAAALPSPVADPDLVAAAAT